MSSPIYCLNSRKIRKIGHVLVERCGKMFRLKVEGRVVADWRIAERMSFLQKWDKKFYNECGFKSV